MTPWLITQAWLELLHVDIVGFFGFGALQRMVIRTRTRAGDTPRATAAVVVAAAETACALYVKQAQCLQRSIVVTRLLRRCGVDAGLVIGCHRAPMKAHAWVEVAGDVVSDQLDDLEHYHVLDRW